MPEESKLPEWECAAADGTQRLRVEGGWIYNVWTCAGEGRRPVFVPDGPDATRDLIAEVKRLRAERRRHDAAGFVVMVGRPSWCVFCFGQRIRRKRTEAKLGLRETATKVGISPTYLSRTETAKEKTPPAEDVIRKLAELLDDDFDELMTLAGRISERVGKVITADSTMPEFLRTVGDRKLSGEDLMKLLPKSSTRP